MSLQRVVYACACRASGWYKNGLCNGGTKAHKKLLQHTKAVQNGVGVEFVRGLWVNLIQKILMEFQQDVLLHAQTVKTNITMMDPF